MIRTVNLTSLLKKKIEVTFAVINNKKYSTFSPLARQARVTKTWHHVLINYLVAFFY